MVTGATLSRANGMELIALLKLLDQGEKDRLAGLGLSAETSRVQMAQQLAKRSAFGRSAWVDKTGAKS